MSYPQKPPGAELFCGARFAYGVALLIAAGRIARSVRAPSEAGVIRLLGARHVVQAAVTARRADRARLRHGAVVDGAHGLSMVAVAMVSPPRRRVAALSAATAAGWASAGFWVARVLG